MQSQAPCGQTLPYGLGKVAADRLVFSDLSGNARLAIRPEIDGGTLIINGSDGGGVELSRNSDEVGLYMTHGVGDSLSVSIKKDKNPSEVLLQNGPAIQLFDEEGFQTYLGQAGIPGKPTPHVTSLTMRKAGMTSGLRPDRFQIAEICYVQNFLSVPFYISVDLA